MSDMRSGREDDRESRGYLMKHNASNDIVLTEINYGCQKDDMFSMIDLIK